MAEAGLELRALRCERDDRVLFSGLNLSLPPGRVLQIAGPNGSGKTTLLRSVAGLASLYEGDILWNGRPIGEDIAGFRAAMLYLGHGAGLKAGLSPRENLRWSCALRGYADAGDKIDGALAKVGLRGYEDNPCASLSAGQQRRANLARLFCLPASLWILDEPFTAIDQAGVAQIEGWIAEFAGGGGSVLLTTHHVMSLQSDLQLLQLGGEQ